MQVQVDIEFDQLLQIVKKLPAVQLSRLKEEMEKNFRPDDNQQLEAFLLKAPTFQKNRWLQLLRQEKLSMNGGQNSFSRYLSSY